MNQKRPAAFANGRPVLEDLEDAVNAIIWFSVLASPHLYRSLGRMPSREYLLRLVDIYVAYIEHDGRYMGAEFEPVPYERREPLAARLRAQFEAWMPPELPGEITETARELLHAEGLLEPEGGWDKVTHEGPEPLEDTLLWPEGVPLLLRG